MTDDEIEVTFEIVCTDLPGAGNHCLHLGIQRDKVMIEGRNGRIEANRIQAYAASPAQYRWVRQLFGPQS